MDTALNDSCRIVTGTLKPTPLGRLYSLAGIAPPDVRREIACAVERQKQSQDNRHLLYHHNPPPSRLKSRRSFLKHSMPIAKDPSTARLELWAERFPYTDAQIPPAECLPPGHHLPWATWRALNRIRAGVGRCRVNRKRWGFSNNDQCDCGTTQTMEHLLSCPNCPVSCTMQDLNEANEKAVALATFWAGLV